MNDDKALKLHAQATVIIAHDHLITGIAARRSEGEQAVFSRRYAPQYRRGGVNVMGLPIGGDYAHKVIPLDDLLTSSLVLFDMLWQEAEESSDDLAICLDCHDVDRAVSENKIGAIITMEGAKPLVEDPAIDPLVALRTLHRLGLRSLQLFGVGWNPIAQEPDGAGIVGGLSDLGRALIHEMNRLGIVIDLAHMSNPTPLFWDILETSQDPIIDSHHNVRAANAVEDSLNDEQITAIAQQGGVIGLLFTSKLLNQTAERATLDDLLRHIDHIVELAGIDHVGLGPDMVDCAVRGLEPSFYLLDGNEQLPKVTEALVHHGYSDADVRKVLGDNVLRVYRQVIG